MKTTLLEIPQYLIEPSVEDVMRAEELGLPTPEDKIYQEFTTIDADFIKSIQPCSDPDGSFITFKDDSFIRTPVEYTKMVLEWAKTKVNKIIIN